jgi:glyoxylase-like metal-dependent hydrolase (beta-lactamase superfamily II)
VRVERIEGAVMAVNSFVVHGPRGLVLVDGQLTISDAARVRRAIEKSGAELVGAIITHPHPDHYAGLAEIVGSRLVPIVATADVDVVMRRDDDLKNAVVGPLMGDEWPAERIFADRIVSDGEVVELGGVEFRVETIGPAESDADTVWRVESGDVFVGDVAYNDHHAYLADGNWVAWLEALERLERELRDATAIHVGHGDTADASVFGRQRGYVETFISAVERNLDAVSAGDHSAVLSAMAGLVGRDDLAFLMQLSIEPVASAIRGDTRRRGAE